LFLITSILSEWGSFFTSCFYHSTLLAIHHLESARLDTERYHPTAKEIGTWYAAGDDSQQEQIAILFEDLKAAYMSEDFMQRKPYPGRIPNVYQSDSVAISLRTKQLLDQIVITAQAQIPSVTNPPQPDPVDAESNTQEQEPSPDFNQISSNLENLIKHIEQRARQRQQPSAPAPIPTPTPTPTQKIVQQSTYQQEYQRVSAKIKRLIIEECEADPFTVYVPDFGENELEFIDRFSKYMTEKNGYTNPDRTEPIPVISDYQREYERRTFEYVVKNPSVVKIREGLINLHFDIEREMKAEGYERQKSIFENGDNEFSEFPVTINPDEREEENDYEDEEEEIESSLQARLNREVTSNHKPERSKQRRQDDGLSL